MTKEMKAAEARLLVHLCVEDYEGKNSAANYTKIDRALDLYNSYLTDWFGNGWKRLTERELTELGREIAEIAVDQWSLHEDTF